MSIRSRVSLGFLCMCLVLGWGLGLARCAVAPPAGVPQGGPGRDSETARILSAAALRTLAWPGAALRGNPHPRVFHLAVRPPIWTLRLDGSRLSQMPGTPVRIKLGPGRHVLDFRHTAVRPLRVVIGPGEPGRILRQRLPWRPGSLLVETTPRPVDATFRFKAPPRLAQTSPRPVGMPITIPFPKNAPLNATIQVYAVGYRHVLREVQLVPGQRSRLGVKLRRLRLRTPGRDPLDDCAREQ